MRLFVTTRTQLMFVNFMWDKVTAVTMMIDVDANFMSVSCKAVIYLKTNCERILATENNTTAAIKYGAPCNKSMPVPGIYTIMMAPMIETMTEVSLDNLNFSPRDGMAKR